MTSAEPELAVVVLSVCAPPELRQAVESLRQQKVPLEIVVVNSGGGDPRLVLKGIDHDLKIMAYSELLWPGATRNRGIQGSRAPWVAFMASDHIAESGWAAERLRLHHLGHRTVSCAMVNSHPRNLYAWAYHISILVRRLPGTPGDEVILYGVSYARSLFRQYGEFREDLRIGEDTDFNDRLAGEDRPIWGPSVRTIHRNPTTFRKMLKSQYARGYRSGLHWPHWHPGAMWARSLARFRLVAGISRRSVRGVDLWLVICSWPLLFMCVLAYGLGVSAGKRESTSTGVIDGGPGPPPGAAQPGKPGLRQTTGRINEGHTNQDLKREAH